MRTNQTTARFLVIAAGVCMTATLAACSAGQISQTAHQVAAVDGGGGNTEMNKLAVRDVTVVVERDNPQAFVKFTAINNDTDMKTYKLDTVSVDGTDASITDNESLNRDCTLVADTEESIDQLKTSKRPCTFYTTVTVKNVGFPPGGNVPVRFSFDNGAVINVNAAVSAPIPEAGTHTLTVDPNAQSSASEH